MSTEDKQVIDMANSSGIRHDKIIMEHKERRRREADMRKQIRQEKRKRQRKVLTALIPALLLILTALVILAAIVAGSLSPADAARAAITVAVLAFGGGQFMAKAVRQ